MTQRDALNVCAPQRAAGLLLLALTSMVGVQPARAANANATWLGGSGNWNNPALWSGGVVPNNGTDTFSVFIDGGKAASSVVSLNVNSTITNLTIDGSDQLSQNNAQSLAIAGGTVTNNGTWSLNSTGNLTDVYCTGGATMTGSGSIVMNNQINNRILPNDNSVCTNASGHTIRGAGQLLVNTGGMKNAGTIIADQSNSLIIDPNALQLTNAGTLRAMSGGTLVLSSDTFANANGLIEALDLSTVVVSNATVMDGTLATSGSGSISSQGATFSNVTNTGTVDVPNNRTAAVTGTLTNNGTWTLSSTGNLTDLYCPGGATIAGSGSIVMGNNPNNRLLPNDNTVCTNDTGHTIRGAGQLLVNTGGLINKGTLIADQGNPLVIDPNGLGCTNQSLLQAQGGGTLVLSSHAFTNTNGVIKAQDASVVQIAATVSGGQLVTTGTGTINVLSGTTLDNVTNNAAIVQPNNRSSTVIHTLTNNGTWALQSTGNLTDLSCTGAATLAGTGSIVMGDAVNNRILTDNTACTNGAQHTIHGAGQLLVNTGGMINNGTIVADLPSGLTIDPNGVGFTNVGALRAANGATLTLSTDGFDNINGVIEAMTGSVVSIRDGATITGGTITSSNGGTVNLQTGPVLVNVTSTAHIVEPNNNGATVHGTFTNNGTWLLNSDGNLTDLYCSGGATLSGSGSIMMSNQVNNRILPLDNTKCTNAAGHTIRGAGQLLVNTGGMLNAGTIIADQSAGLTIDPNGLGFTNAGSLQSTGGGTLVLTAGTFTNTTGLIEALDQSTVVIGGATLVGGTLSTSGTGSVSIGGGSVLTNVTNAGAIAQGNNQTVSVTGTLTNNGSYFLNSAGNLTDLYCIAGATLAGTGSVVMTNQSNNRILTDNSPCTNAAGHTIRGAGQLLANTGGMVNQGTIVADQTPGLVIDPNGIGFTNHGTLHAVGSNGITISPDPFTTNGTVLIDSGSSLARSGDYTQTGGTTRLDGGTLSATSGLVDVQGGNLDGAGIVSGTVSNAGHVRPGGSGAAATLNVAGTYAQTAGGALDIEIAGPTAGSGYDRLAASGAVTLNGTFNVTLINGFLPTLGTTFTVLTFGSRSGDFATYNGLMQSNGVTFSAAFINNALVLTVTHEATATRTATRTPSVTNTPSLTGTATQTATATATNTPTRTATLTSTPTLTPTATPSATATGSATKTPTPTSTTTLTPTPTSSGTPSVTPSETATPAFILVTGTVRKPGPHGDDHEHGLVTVAGITVEAFICEQRKTCVDSQNNAVGSAVTDGDGHFSISISSALVNGKLLLLVASVDGVKIRALVTPHQLHIIGGGGTAGMGFGGADTELSVDPISDAAVLLLDQHGIDNYSDDGIDAVITAVDDANAASNFAGMTTAEAVTSATTTAAANLTVQMALQDNQLTPTPTATATATPTPRPCVGDCDGDGQVTIDELIKGVNIALDKASLQTCPQFDVDHSGTVTVDELIIGVNNALLGCVR